MRRPRHEMNICRVSGERVRWWMKVEASSRVSIECFFDVYGCGR
jgi:hypothetical protein